MGEKEIDIFASSNRRSRPEMLHDILNELQYTGLKCHVIQNITVWYNNLTPMLKMLMNRGYVMREKKTHLRYSLTEKGYGFEYYLTEKGYNLMLELREITVWLR